MKGIGLVFAGGGGKGAYQIGVWKYLHEYGLDQYIRGVSGTSVGALNAALFASGSYENAERLWMNIEPEQILSPRKISPEEIISWFVRFGGAAVAGTAAAGPVGGALNVAAQPIITALTAMLGRRYAFSRDGLLHLMRDGVNFWALQESEFPCYATCLEIPQFQVRRFDLRNYSEEEIQTVLLASSAIPFIFDMVHFDGQAYIDGGIPKVGDNVPIAPIYDMGVEYILVVHLSQDSLIVCSDYPDSTILEVVPSTDLGRLVDGTLDFTTRGAQWRIEQGYQDAKRILEPSVQQIILQGVTEQIFCKSIERQRQFNSRIQELHQQMADIKRQRESGGFEEFYQRMMEEE